MNGNKLSPRTIGFGLSMAITSVLSALLVVVKETNEPLLAWMKGATSHHWITHGLIDVVLFVVLGVLLSKAGGGKGLAMKPGGVAGAIVAAVVVSFLVISGFYLFEG